VISNILLRNFSEAINFCNQIIDMEEKFECEAYFWSGVIYLE